MIIYISGTGEIHGRGSDPYKWVSGLSREERQVVQIEEKRLVDLALGKFNPDEPGIVVLVDPMGKGPNRSGYKVVRYRSGRYVHREPTPGQMEVIRKALGALGVKI